MHIRDLVLILKEGGAALGRRLLPFQAIFEKNLPKKRGKTHWNCIKAGISSKNMIKYQKSQLTDIFSRAYFDI